VKLCWNLQKVSKSKVSKNLTDYGAFVDLVASMACCTSPTWPGSASSIPSEIVNVGDEIDVKVLIRPRTQPCFLGLKQLGEDPWVAIKARYPESTRVPRVSPT
jgi:small subunit ribosomal protein S1